MLYLWSFHRGLKRYTGEPLTRRKARSPGACLHAHVTTQVQLESQLNFAMFVSPYGVPTVLRGIPDFDLVSFDVCPSTHTNMVRTCRNVAGPKPNHSLHGPQPSPTPTPLDASAAPHERSHSAMMATICAGARAHPAHVHTQHIQAQTFNINARDGASRKLHSHLMRGA